MPVVRRTTHIPRSEVPCGTPRTTMVWDRRNRHTFRTDLLFCILLCRSTLFIKKIIPELNIKAPLVLPIQYLLGGTFGAGNLKA